MTASGGKLYFSGHSGASDKAGEVALVSELGGYATVSDTTNTSVAIPVLSGGTSFIYASALTSLSIASVVNTPVEDRLKFTLASGGSVSIPASCDVCPSGFTFEGGKSYVMAVMGGMVIAAEYQPGV